MLLHVDRRWCCQRRHERDHNANSRFEFNRGKAEEQEQQGTNVSKIGRKSSFLKVRRAVMGENLLTSVAGLRKSQLDAMRNAAREEAESMKVDHAEKNEMVKDEEMKALVNPLPDRKSTTGTVDFSALSDDVSKIMSHFNGSPEKLETGL